MSDLIFAVEISGEGAFHKFLVQSGWSGKDYLFHYNAPTNTHMRAYHSIEAYRAERVDMHKTATVWPIMANLLPVDQVQGHVFVDAPVATEAPKTEVQKQEAATVPGVQTEASSAGEEEEGDADDDESADDELTGKKFKTLQVIAREEGVPGYENLHTAKELIDAITAARATR